MVLNDYNFKNKFKICELATLDFSLKGLGFLRTDSTEDASELPRFSNRKQMWSRNSPARAIA